MLPVLFGQGRRLLDRLSADHVELQLTRDAAGVTHLHYRINSEQS